MTETDNHIKRLREMREALVKERRAYPDYLLNNTSAAPSVTAPGFVKIQEAIEAVDRAIADEKRMIPPKPLKQFSEEDPFGEN